MHSIGTHTPLSKQLTLSSTPCLLSTSHLGSGSISSWVPSSTLGHLSIYSLETRAVPQDPNSAQAPPPHRERRLLLGPGTAPLSLLLTSSRSGPRPLCRPSLKALALAQQCSLCLKRSSSSGPSPSPSLRYHLLCDNDPHKASSDGPVTTDDPNHTCVSADVAALTHTCSRSLYPQSSSPSGFSGVQSAFSGHRASQCICSWICPAQDQGLAHSTCLVYLLGDC